MTEPTHSSTTNVSSVLQLDWQDAGGNVTVTPRDQDRFVIRVRRAIDILNQANRRDEFEQQFKLLLRMLADWLRQQNNVARAYLTHRDGALSFVVICNHPEYSEAFEDDLSDLDFGIANDSDLTLIKMDAIALPPASDESISSFLAPDFALEFPPDDVGHGDRSGSHSLGEQES